MNLFFKHVQDTGAVCSDKSVGAVYETSPRQPPPSPPPPSAEPRVSAGLLGSGKLLYRSREQDKSIPGV